MMKSKNLLLLIVILLLVVNLSACGNAENAETNETGRIYECNYKSLNINTKITTIFNGEEISITGNIFKLLTDPLTVKDSNDNILGYAGDAYGIISQDDHGIYIADIFDINMSGNVDLWGNSYQLKDSEGNIIGNAEFNMFNTNGSIKDINGELIAMYSSAPLMNDYTVTIYDNGICSDISILMIIASYVSDYMADS